MNKILIIFVLLLVTSGTAYAQSLTIDLNKGRFNWTWKQGQPPNDGTADGFNIKCGPSTGNYTTTTTIADPKARSAMVKPIIGGAGVYFCVATAYNKYGESGPSGEINFDAGAIASNPLTFSVDQAP